MKVLVIGLGEFGRAIAEKLTDMSNEVVGIDCNENIINSIKEKISLAYIMDASKPDVLRELPLKEMDCTIVAVGHSMDASLRIIAALKDSGIENVFARGIDSTHISILKAMNVKNILLPERCAAEFYARKLGETQIS